MDHLEEVDHEIEGVNTGNLKEKCSGTKKSKINRSRASSRIQKAIERENKDTDSSHKNQQNLLKNITENTNTSDNLNNTSLNTTTTTTNNNLSSSKKQPDSEKKQESGNKRRTSERKKPQLQIDKTPSNSSNKKQDSPKDQFSSKKSSSPKPQKPLSDDEEILEDKTNDEEDCQDYYHNAH